MKPVARCSHHNVKTDPNSGRQPKNASCLYRGIDYVVLLETAFTINCCGINTSDDLLFPYNETQWPMPSMGKAYRLCIEVIILQTPLTNTKAERIQANSLG